MLKHVGAGWVRQGKKGEFMSLSLDVEKLQLATEKDGKLSFLMFVNEKKEEGSKHPDYVIMTAVDDEGVKP